MHLNIYIYIYNEISNEILCNIVSLLMIFNNLKKGELISSIKPNMSKTEMSCNTKMFSLFVKCAVGFVDINQFCYEYNISKRTAYNYISDINCCLDNLDQFNIEIKRVSTSIYTLVDTYYNKKIYLFKNS